MKKVVFLIFFLSSSLSFGAGIKNVAIVGEKIVNCHLDTESISASLASFMRYNRIDVVQGKDSPYILYHNVSAIGGGNSCSVNVSVEYYYYKYLLAPQINKNIFSKVQLCQNSFVLTGPEYDMQTRVNDAAKEAADKCLYEIYKN